MGIGLYTGLRFFGIDGYEFSNGDLNISGYFNTGILSYIELDMSLRYGLINRISGDNSGDSWSRLQIKFSLLGKYPVQVNRQVSIFPLFGFGLDLELYGKSIDYDFEWKREDLKDEDTLQLKFGGGMNYNFSQNIVFRTALLYDIFLYSKLVAKNSYDQYSRHGPNIMIGISYVF